MALPHAGAQAMPYNKEEIDDFNQMYKHNMEDEIEERKAIHLSLIHI